MGPGDLEDLPPMTWTTWQAARSVFYVLPEAPELLPLNDEAE